MVPPVHVVGSVPGPKTSNVIEPVGLFPPETVALTDVGAMAAPTVAVDGAAIDTVGVTVTGVMVTSAYPEAVPAPNRDPPPEVTMQDGLLQ